MLPSQKLIRQVLSFRMLSSIRSNQPYANEPVYILEPQWPRCWMADDITTARIVRGRCWDKSRVDSTTAHHHRFTGIAWSTNPCRWRHRLDGDVKSQRWPGVRWLRRLRGKDQSGHVGHGLVTRTEHGERVTEGVRWLIGTSRRVFASSLIQSEFT